MTVLTRLRKLFTPNAWKLLALAFAAGLLLFLLLWWDQRDNNDFYKTSQPNGSNAGTEALPAPLPPDVAPGGLQLSSPSRENAAANEQLPRLINEPAPTPATPSPHADAAHSAGAAADRTLPLLTSNPPPRYPRRAQRRGIEGTVRVRVTVATNGSVDRLELAQTSGNRDLDRAALEAVRRWRFQPATRSGQPVSAEVVVPIVFDLGD